MAATLDFILVSSIADMRAWWYSSGLLSTPLGALMGDRQGLLFTWLLSDHWVQYMAMKWR